MRCRMPMVKRPTRSQKLFREDLERERAVEKIQDESTRLTGDEVRRYRKRLISQKELVKRLQKISEISRRRLRRNWPIMWGPFNG